MDRWLDGMMEPEGWSDGAQKTEDKTFSIEIISMVFSCSCIFGRQIDCQLHTYDIA